MLAQIEHFLKSGLQPSHIDTHQGTVFHTIAFLESYIKLAIEYNLVPMLLKPNEQSMELIQSQDLNLDLTFLESLAESDLQFLDFLYISDNDTLDIQEKEQEYIEIISNLPEGISQIIIHPGYNDDDLKKININSHSRFFDFSIFRDIKIRKIIKQQNIELVSWGDMVKQE